MSRIFLLLVPGVTLIAAACGSNSDFQNTGGAGTAGSAVSMGGDESSGGSSGASAGKTGSAGSVSGSAGKSTTGGTAAGGGPGAGGAGDLAGAGGDAAPGTGGQGAGGDGTNPGACPDVFGAYTIKSAEGTCGTLNKDAPQSIQGTDIACFGHFVSTPPSGAQGVNGGAALDMNGNFTGAMLYLDTVKRNPCSGTYSAAAQTMTVKCGGAGDLCTVVLARKK